MTLEEAKKVAKIIGTADRGCPVCVGRLVEMSRKLFPEFRWTLKADYADDPVIIEHEPPRVDADGNRL